MKTSIYLNISLLMAVSSYAAPVRRNISTCKTFLQVSPINESQTSIHGPRQQMQMIGWCMRGQSPKPKTNAPKLQTQMIGWCMRGQFPRRKTSVLRRQMRTIKWCTHGLFLSNHVTETDASLLGSKTWREDSMVVECGRHTACSSAGRRHLPYLMIT